MVMKRTYFKIVLKEIKKSFGRFMAIFGIVALGVGFLTGLLVTTPDMHYSVDEYYDNYNMVDIFIKGTMGITDNDISELLSMDEINEIMPAYVTDTLMEIRNNEILATRVYGIPLLKDNVKINQLELLEGRMPENNNECVIERTGGFLSGVPIGTKLTISKDNENYDDLDDIYEVKEFTVVGIVSNTFYFSLEREQTNIGSGKLNSIIYVDESSYAMDVYTDLYITANGAKEMDSFSKEYETKMKSIVKSLETIGKERSKIRFDEVLSDATDKLNDGKKEYEDGKMEAETELADAYKELEDGRKELKDAWIKIQDGKVELADAKVTLEEEKLKAEDEINDAKIKLQDALKELEDGEIELKDAWIELQDGQKKYQDGYMEYLDAKKELEDAQEKFDKGERELLDGERKLADAKRDIRQGERELALAEAELEDGQRQYNNGVKELQRQKEKFEQGMDSYLTRMPFTSAEELFTAIDRGNAGAKMALDQAVAGSVKFVEDKIDELKPEINLLESSIVETKLGLEAAETEEKRQELTGTLMYLEGELAKANAGMRELEQALAQMPKDSSIFINGWRELKGGERQLANAKAEIDYGLREIEKGYEEIRIGKREIQKAERELEDGRKELEENRRKLKDGWVELEEGRIELEDAKKELDDGFRKYYDGRKELDDGWIEYKDGLVELASAEETFKIEIADAEEEIRKGEIDLDKGIKEYNDGVKELADGEAEYLEAKADVEKELAEAEQELIDAQKEIDDLETPKWYVLDRNYNMSYASFLMNAEKVEAVSKVFPIFFYLIAALVALTTMTRMVEEERTQIGTLKALGYTKGTIMFKYLAYCGLASVLGSIVGMIVGFKLIPYVIWNAYGVMYHLPRFMTQFNTGIASISSGLAILSTMMATIYAVNYALKEKPSTLMLPRAPKAGKRILLERVGFIWSRMSFNHKATARNLFRYKKHFFMTVIGIGGCTALLVAGFGIKDSIGAVANTQFIEIFKYDMVVDIDRDKEFDPDLKLILEDKAMVTEYMEVNKEKGKVWINDEEFETTIFVPSNAGEIDKFIDLRDRKKKTNISFDDSSVIITEKLAEILNLSIGDEILLENDDEIKSSFIITGITENYLGNYVYLSELEYKQKYSEISRYNSMVLKTPVTDSKEQDDLISRILSKDNVINAEYISSIKSTFDNLLSSIDYIVIVIILASGTLAFIVLYNLTNININERKKELATLKVLGFYNEEVSRYIFRETAILTLIGIGVGLLLGILLHSFIINTIENIDFMFGREASSLSYALSAIITLIFSLIVNLFMSKKLKKIEMVESMKAID